MHSLRVFTLLAERKLLNKILSNGSLKRGTYIQQMTKKFLVGAVLAFAGTAAQAQSVYQVQNADFEGNWDEVAYSSYKGVEPAHWNSFLTGTGKLKSMAGRNQLDKSTEVRPGSTGKSSVKIFDRSVMFGIIAQGNLTTGCINMGSASAADASGNYNYTDASNPDFNQPFTGCPDSMVVWVKYVSTKNFKAKANTVLHTQGYYQDPEANSIVAKVIAKAENAEITSSNEWQRLSIPFVYTGEKMRPAFALVSFATNVTPGKGTGKDYMLIDDLQYVYNSNLKSFTINGAPVEIPAPGATADCSQYTYDASQVACLSDGHSATIEQAYDEATALLTVTVKADDWSESKHEQVYKFQFKKSVAPASVTEVTICGQKFEGLQAGVTTYELPYVYNPGYVFTATAADGSTLVLGDNGALKVDADNKAKTYTFGVANAEQQVTNYVFTFTDAVASAESGDYKGALSVTLTNASDESTLTPLANTTIVLSKNSNNTVNLALNDFSFGGIPVGDIFVPNVPITDGKIEATRTIILTDFDADGNPVQGFGSMLGALPVKVSASLLSASDKETAASIDIITTDNPMLATMFKGIHVDFVPYSIGEQKVEEDGFGGRTYYTCMQAKGRVTKETAKFLQVNNCYVNSDGEQRNLPMTYVDLTEAKIDADVALSDVMAGAPKVNNTLVYVAEGATLKGDNVVVGNTVEKLVLADDATFNAPKAFTAKKVSTTRQFETGEKAAASVILPFAAEAAQIAGKVYKFAGLLRGELNFETVNGKLEANVPYLIVAPEANPLANVEDAAVAVTPDTEMAVTHDLYKHVGSYTVQPAVADPSHACYDYLNGGFKKQYDAQLHPFRALIVNTDMDQAEFYKVAFDGCTTGIFDVTADSSKVDVYTIEGKLVRKQVDAITSLQGLPAGTYIVGGKKVVK